MEFQEKAEQLLLDFGYSLVDGLGYVYYRNGYPADQRWVPQADGGFYRYDAFQGGWEHVPYQNEADGTIILTWPPEMIIRIYSKKSWED